MNKTPLDEKIRQIENSILYLVKALPYADHGAYQQDKERIASLKGELSYWEGLRALEAQSKAA